MDGVAARSFEHRGERCRFVRCSSLPLPSRCQNAYGDRPVRNRLPHCLEHLKRKTHCDFPRTRHTYRHVDWKAVIGIDAGGSRARSEAVSARDQYAGRVSQMIRMHLVWMEVLPSASHLARLMRSELLQPRALQWKLCGQRGSIECRLACRTTVGFAPA